MSGIESLAGTLSPQDLGIVALREHLLLGRHGWNWDPNVKFDRAAAFEHIVSELEQFKKAGGRTLVDASVITLGRNVPFYKRLAEVSGVNIVVATGFGSQEAAIPGHFLGRAYRITTDPPQHWLREIPGHFYPSHGESMEYLMFLIYNELTEGMAAPSMIRSKLKAGIVRTGCGAGSISRLEEFAIRGAGMAARYAGVSVITTTIAQAQRQFDLLRAEGLPSERIVIGQCDDGRAVDIKRDQHFAGQGAYVAYDHIGWEDGAAHAMPDEQRAKLVKEMVAAGFAQRVVLSCSAVGCALGVAASKHGYAYLLKSFVPLLAKSGVSEEAIHTMLAENPQRILTAQQDEESAAQLQAFAEGFRSASQAAGL
jgi:phosphotriesterase-related protein